VCDEVLVMYAGIVAERAPVVDIFKNPKHPYTLGLLSSIPRLEGERKTRLNTIEGMVPSLYELPKGCRFTNRCQYVMEKCHVKPPQLKPVDDDGHVASCYLYG
jgi:oligopeptide/dipeptide ABC transporter ATP-binding protein